MQKLAVVLFLFLVSGCEKLAEPPETASPPVEVESSNEAAASSTSQAPPAFGSVEHVLDQAIQQIEQNDKRPLVKLLAAPQNLEEGKTAVGEAIKQTDVKQPITAALEYRGWYLFGTAGAADEALKFHAGYAVRKGDTKVYYFGFW